jgi:hypothetical protein
MIADAKICNDRWRCSKTTHLQRLKHTNIYLVISSVVKKWSWWEKVGVCMLQSRFPFDFRLDLPIRRWVTDGHGERASTFAEQKQVLVLCGGRRPWYVEVRLRASPTKARPACPPAQGRRWRGRGAQRGTGRTSRILEAWRTHGTMWFILIELWAVTSRLGSVPKTGTDQPTTCCTYVRRPWRSAAASACSAIDAQPRPGN